MLRFSYMISKLPTVSILPGVYDQHFIPNLSALVTFVLNVVFLSAKVGYAVVHLVEALHYELEGGGFDFQWYYWNSSLI
jgi:hypothetical protein